MSGTRLLLSTRGRCCGRKPILYKLERRLFCPRCDRAYDPETRMQIENWAWKLRDGKFVDARFAQSPAQEHCDG
jgi:hypothetical protein